MAQLRKGKTIYGGPGADMLLGTSEADWMFGGKGNDRLYGFAGGDHLHGGNLEDSLYGGWGDDRLTGGEGFDKLYGGAGNDTLIIDELDAVVDGGDGQDRVFLTSPTPGYGVYLHASTDFVSIEVVLGTAAEDIFMWGQDSAIVIAGGGGDDEIEGGAGRDVIKGGAGNDLLNGLQDTDTAVFSGNFEHYVLHRGDAPGAAVVVVDIRPGAPDGTDTIFEFERFRFADVVLTIAQLQALIGTTPTEGDDVLDGGDGDDMIDALAGHDVVNGNGGNDTLTGGAGFDHISGGAGDDTIYADADDVEVDGGEGRDTLILTGENGFAGPGIGGWTGFEIVIGTAANDVIEAFSPVVPVAGLIIDSAEGDDYVGGTRADDTVVAGAGNDAIFGGDGIDTVVFSGYFADYVFVPEGSEAFAALDASGGIPGLGPDGNDLIGGVEILQFADVTVLVSDLWAAPRTVTGTEADDVITASDYDDVIDTLGGTDFVFGGAGNDTYIAGAGSDTFIGEAGSDTVRFSGNATDYFIEVSGNLIHSFDTRGGFALGPDGVDGFQAEVLEFADVTFSIIVEIELGSHSLQGTDAADMLIGGMSADSLSGLAGDDYLYGGEGADVLEGGAGDDWLVSLGGAGTAVFSGTSSDYDIGFDADSHMIVTDLISGRDGQDTLVGFTRVQFADAVFIY